MVLSAGSCPSPSPPPKGVLTAAGEREILPRLTADLARVSGLSGNEAFTAMIGGTVHVLEPDRVYGGGVNQLLVVVELKLPNIGLSSVPFWERRADRYPLF